MKRAVISNIVDSLDSSDIAVAAGATTVYTKAFKVAFGEYFALAYRAVSATGTPVLKIELQAGINDAPPTTEGADDENYIEPENAVNIEDSLTTETWHIKSLSPAVSCYLRLKLTGAGATAVVFNAKLHKQEEF